jgi:hypothetical protein
MECCATNAARVRRSSRPFSGVSNRAFPQGTGRQRSSRWEVQVTSFGGTRSNTGYLAQMLALTASR